MPCSIGCARTPSGTRGSKRRAYSFCQLASLPAWSTPSSGFDDVRQVGLVIGTRREPGKLQTISHAANALVGPTIEARYHGALFGARPVGRGFVRLFDWHAERGLAQSCRALRGAIEQNLRQLAAPELDRRRSWLEYFDGRLLHQQDLLAEAAEALRAVAAGDDVPLQVAALMALTDVLNADYRWGEARDVAHRQLDIARAAGDVPAERSALFALAQHEYQIGRTRIAGGCSRRWNAAWSTRRSCPCGCESKAC